MSDPVKQYKELVESLRELYNHCFTLKDLTAEEDPDGEQARALLDSLAPDQVDIVNRLFHRLYESGIYMALDRLNDLQTSRRLVLHFDEVRLPAEPLTNSLAHDWITLCEDGSWRALAECPVHGAPLQIDEVGIRSGLLRYSLDYYAARTELFPFANAYEEGGCMAGPEKTARVPYCDDCRRALVAWSVETGIRSGLPDDESVFLALYTV